MNWHSNHDCYLLMAKNKTFEKELEQAKRKKKKTKPLFEIAITVHLRFLGQAGESFNTK
jgi:hypothetical protein